VLFLALRVSSLAWGLLVTSLVPVNRDAYPYVGVEQLPAGHLLEPWQRWDTPIFQMLAEQGYGARGNLVLTPPLYPTLINIVSHPLGGQTMLAAMLISSAFCLFALINFYRLARLELGEEADARRAVLHLAVFPTAFFLFAAYTDAIFLAGAVGALYYARRSRWWPAAIWGAIGAGSRIVGSVLLLPLAWEGWRQWRQNDPPRRVPWPTLACLAATLAGAAVLPLYSVFVLGASPLAPLYTQTQRFSSTLVVPGQNVVDAIVKALTYPQDMLFPDWFDLAFVLIFLALVIPVWRRLPSVYGVYYTSLLLFSLTISDNLQPLKAQCRYVLGLFPAFLVIASLGRKPVANRLILYTSIALLLLLSGQFFIGGWVA
jgi:hypothetical protein